VSSKGCLHGQRNELLEKGKIQERCTDDYKGQYSGRNYTFQCELGSEKSTESTPGPRLNRAAELASFWDPQRKIVIIGAPCGSEDAWEIEHWTTLWTGVYYRWRHLVVWESLL
jgi:hypothetical protein